MGKKARIRRANRRYYSLMLRLIKSRFDRGWDSYGFFLAKKNNLTNLYLYCDRKGLSLKDMVSNFRTQRYKPLETEIKVEIPNGPWRSEEEKSALTKCLNTLEGAVIHHLMQ